MYVAKAVWIGLLLSITTSVAAADYVWIEGEDAPRQNVQRHGWYDSVIRANLSGGDWLSHFGAGQPPTASYQVRIAQSGDYHFWVRCNPVAQARLSYRWDNGAWQSLDLSQPVDSVNIATDGKPDLRFIAWVPAGTVQLEHGSHELEFRFHSQNNNHGAIDCLVLSLAPFRPRGILKPGERTGLANPGFFAWEPDTDPFGPEALVDLSGLNEDVAGGAGRVRSSGGQFVLAGGQPARFWAANAGPAIWDLDRESHQYLARRLAKLGVNMVRLHGPLYRADNPTVQAKRLDGLQHLVYALKQEGIYSALSFYFPLWYHLDGNRPTFMLVFYDEQLQRDYYGWARQLLTSPNPHSGQPLGKDPAVAIVELVNEDSHFFWTFGQKNTSPARWQALKKLHGDWLRQRYGTLEQAVTAWGGARNPGDRPAAGEMELYDAYNMTTAGIDSQPRLRKRLGDQVRFLTENMRGFNERTIRYLQTDCGYDGLVSCGNWHVSDPAKLDALERYCYTAGQVIDHHGYFDHGHKDGGDGSSRWSVRPGHEFTSQSALMLRQTNPLPYVETEGYPHITSEIGWPAPNMYRAEFTFLTSAYGSLQGLDGVFSFALGGSGWDQQLNKFPLSDPVGLGCFPAAALIYRRGLVQEAPVVVQDNLNLDDLYALNGTPVHAAAALDQLRAEDVPAAGDQQGAVKQIDPLAFYVGRVVRSFNGQVDASFRRDLSTFVDREQQQITSATGELVWDYGKGLVTVNTPRAQGAAGFLGQAGELALQDVSIRMENAYGSVTIVAMDDQPIAQSHKLLIQCMTIEQFHDFRATGPNSLSGKIESTGSAPIGVEQFRVVVALKHSSSTPPRIVPCDEHGYPRDVAVRMALAAGGIAFVLDSSSPYHVVLR